VDNIRILEFQEFGTTNVHSLTIALMVCPTVLVLASRRSAAIFAVLAVCVFMPAQQRYVIGGLDFSMLRLIMVVAWLRVLVRGEYRGLGFGKLDRVVVLWALSASIFYVLRIGPSGIVYRLGVSFDVLTAYFLIRALVRTRGEVFVLWRHLAWIVLALSPFLLYELYAQHNVFGIFNYTGWEIVEVRNGRTRCQGPFAHPILAGTFAAAVMPVFIGMLLGKRQRLLFASACVAAIAIVIAAGSSGPVIACVVGAFGWGIWLLRKHTRAMIWATVGLAVVIHFVREQPVWQLIGRLSSLTGGSGYHRSALIDAFIRRFGEWALMGTDNTAHWGWGLQDTTSQYVGEGIGGGLVTFVLFIVMLRVGFVQLRLARETFERLEGPKSPWALLAWGSSVSLAVHCVSFISVAYFDQTFQFLLFFFATVPAFARFRRPKRVKSHAAPRAASAPRPIPAERFRSS